MTGSLTTRYHKPTPLDEELLLEARIQDIDGRKITMVGELWAGDVMTASCEGLFVVPGDKSLNRSFGSHD